jgi:hypothetical protein
VAHPVLSFFTIGTNYQMSDSMGPQNTRLLFIVARRLKKKTQQNKTKAIPRTTLLSMLSMITRISGKKKPSESEAETN